MLVQIDLSNFRITPQVIKLLTEIHRFGEKWRSIGKLAPERLTQLQRIATIESVGSSTRIEGSQLSDREVEALLSDLRVKKFATRDEQEVAGYANVMETIFENYEAIGLTENHIKQLHRDLLQYSTKDKRHRGAYKTLANHVEAFDASGKSIGVVFRTATPFETPLRMAELVEWTRTSLQQEEWDPLIIIAVFVVVFLEIHPFQDSNGRLSRILTTMLLMRAGYDYIPFSSLESVIERNKPAYYRALRQTQAAIRTEKPNWSPWILFFLQTLQSHKARLEARVQAELTLFGNLPELSAALLELARGAGRLTVSGAAEATGSNRNTIKDHLKSLVESGHLARNGGGRGTWYSPL